eukprot:1919085-Lingulodinium_polyedra.AAC.1
MRLITVAARRRSPGYVSKFIECHTDIDEQPREFAESQKATAKQVKDAANSQAEAADGLLS